MDSVVTRLNALVGTTLTMLATCAGLIAVSTIVNEWYLNPSAPTGRITIRPSTMHRLDLSHPLKPSHFRSIDRMVVFLDVAADFTPAFNWNTKQVYVYAVAHYESKEYRRNEVTLWDTIITGKSAAKLQLTRVADYYLDDISVNLRDANVTVRLWYHIMAHSGLTVTREIPQAAAWFVAK